MEVEKHCLQLQNAGKHISATVEFQNFPGEHARDARLKGPLPGCQTCPPVQNLNETSVIKGDREI